MRLMGDFLRDHIQIISVPVPSPRRKCVECGRVFDLMDEDEAGEWFYGHDCEV